ncbi:Limb region 1 -like protein [Blomia tropicalis]|nr:Limb region 1 -like protein [Blomia tropicalis]
MSLDYSHFFREEEDPEDEYLEKQYQEFFEVIRIHLIIVLLVSVLCFVANFIISRYKNIDLNSEVPSSRTDRLTYWVAIKLCMFGLAIAIGIALLLPMTIISNEILLLYPENEYPNLRWLNDNLIKQLWHYIFIFSNFCFILIPFSYFFAESTGFSTSTDSFCSRILQAILETQLTLTIILSCIFLGLSTVFPIFQANIFQLITFWLNFPFLYSCISFFGAILLLVCIPKGILNLVYLLDGYITRPYLVNSTTEKYDRVSIEETVLISRMQLMNRYREKYGEIPANLIPNTKDQTDDDNKSLSYELLSELISKNDRRRELHQKITASWIRSKIPWLLYPLAMALLVTTTGITCAIVFFNLSTRLLKLNDSTRGQQFVLGIASISKMGIVGAIFQTLLIIYIGIATLVGMYNLPILGLLQPIRGKTPYIKIMLNCMVVLILSSALPLFTRTVGITNFDLFGNFGQIVWTQNHHLVLFYNCAFLVALSICLCHSVVVKLSKEFFSRLHRFLLYLNRLLLIKIMNLYVADNNVL